MRTYGINQLEDGGAYSLYDCKTYGFKSSVTGVRKSYGNQSSGFPSSQTKRRKRRILKRKARQNGKDQIKEQLKNIG